MTNDSLISFHSSVWLAEGKTRRGIRKWKERGQERKDGWLIRRAPAVSHSIHFFSRPPMNRWSAMKKRSYVCTLPLSALVTSQVNTNWCINFLTSGSPDSTFFSRLCPCPLSFFLFLFPRCIITLFIQSCQGFPSVWSLFAALLLPFSLVSHCLPFFIFHLTLQYSLSTSPHLIFHHPTPSALRVWQELQWLYWHFSVIFFFLNYYNFRSSEPA